MCNGYVQHASVFQTHITYSCDTFFFFLMQISYLHVLGNRNDVQCCTLYTVRQFFFKLIMFKIPRTTIVCTQK